MEGEGIASLPFTSQITPQQTVPDVHCLVPFVSSTDHKVECSTLCIQVYKRMLQNNPDVLFSNSLIYMYFEEEMQSTRSTALI